MIKFKVETQSGKWNEFVPKCRQANKLKKAKTLFTATFLTELEFTGCRTVPCNKFTCAQYVISVCSKFTVVDIISPSIRSQPFYVYVLYNWTALFSLSVRAAGVIRHSLTTLQPRPFSVSWLAPSFLDHLLCALPVTYYSSKAAYSQQIDKKYRL